MTKECSVGYDTQMLMDIISATSLMQKAHSDIGSGNRKLHGSGATASAVSVSAHCQVCYGLRPATDMAIGDSHGLLAP